MTDTLSRKVTLLEHHWCMEYGMEHGMHGTLCGTWFGTWYAWSTTYPWTQSYKPSRSTRRSGGSHAHGQIRRFHGASISFQTSNNDMINLKLTSTLMRPLAAIWIVSISLALDISSAPSVTFDPNRQECMVKKKWQQCLCSLSPQFTVEFGFAVPWNFSVRLRPAAVRTSERRNSTKPN